MVNIKKESTVEIVPDAEQLRDFMLKWEEVQIKEAKNSQLRILVDGQNFVMFFIYQDKVFGATEQHRVTFAKMLTPDEETNDAWRKEAHFMAFNLSSAIGGKPTQEIFYLEDLEDINIISKDQAFEKLSSESEQHEKSSIVGGTQSILQVLSKMQSGEPQILNNKKK